jgi:hypothetical protein
VLEPQKIRFFRIDGSETSLKFMQEKIEKIKNKVHMLELEFDNEEDDGARVATKEIAQSYASFF